MGTFEAFIFDVDGTLLNTLPDLTVVTNATLESFGFPPHTQDAIKGFIGGGGRRLIEKAVPAGTSEETMDQAFERWKRIHETRGINLTREYPGVTNVLTALKARGMKLGALSNKFDAGVQVLVPRFFPGVFQAMHGESAAIPRKPDPTGLLLTMRELGVSPDRTAYVGDSKGDMVTAHAAGTFAVGVAWGYQERAALEEGGADRIIDRPEELLDMLQA